MLAEFVFAENLLGEKMFSHNFSAENMFDGEKKFGKKMFSKKNCHYEVKFARLPRI